MDYTPYEEFAKEKLGFEFNDIGLLVTALTHRSYVNEHKKTHEHNERLEFLGDAVLELVSSDYLYRNFDYPETDTLLIYSHPEGEEGESAPRHKPEYLIPAWVLVGINVFLGLFPAIAISLLDSGFSMLF